MKLFMFVLPRFVRFGYRLASFVAVAVAPSTHSTRRIVGIRRSHSHVVIYSFVIMLIWCFPSRRMNDTFTPPNSLSYQKTP